MMTDQIRAMMKYILFTLMFLLMHSAIVSSASAEIQIKNLDVIADVTAALEYNDNLFLENDKYDDADSDFCIRIMPNLTVSRSFDDHKLSFDLIGDYMRGLRTDASAFNTVAEGLLNLKFSGGLNAAIRNTYSRVERDWDFNNAPGVTTSISNHIGIDAAYPFGNRLTLEGGYDHGWEKYKEEADAAYLNSDKLTAALYFPIAWNMEGFGRYSLYRQYSDDNDLWNYNEHLWQAGAEWKGPYRFSVEASAGYSLIDYDEPKSYQHEDIVYRLTVKSRITETLNSKAWVGMNSYGNAEYGAEFRHQYSEDAYTSFQAGKRTVRSYSSLSEDRLMETVRASVKHRMRIFWNGRLELEGGYVHQSSFVDSDFWFGRTNLLYPLKERWDIGLYYDYRQRISDDDRYDYINHLIGLFCTFRL